MSKVIKLENVSYQVMDGEKEKKVLSQINYTFSSSKITAITGPSGSGKTTLLYALGGLLNHVDGNVYIDETSLYSLEEVTRDYFRKNNMSMIFQNYNLFSFMNVEDNILMPYYVKKKDVENEVKSKCLHYLEKFGLGDIRKRTITSLSGGEQQRIAIIRSIIDNPGIILCDEPTANLDKENTEKFMSMLTQMVNEVNSTVIIVSHDEEVCQYADNVLCIVDGKIGN